MAEKFKITGLGFYRCANGSKAEVTGPSQYPGYAWQGRMVEEGLVCAWRDNGYYQIVQGSHLDIVGLWEEPEKPETFVDVQEQDRKTKHVLREGVELTIEKCIEVIKEHAALVDKMNADPNRPKNARAIFDVRAVEKHLRDLIPPVV